jgi:cytochrome c553
MRRSHRLGILLIVAGLCAVAPAWARGDAAAGAQKAQEVCASCHGPDGNSPNPMYPRLAGQYPDYLVKALEDYKSGMRKNPIMSGFVASLSQRDMENLAAYFSRQRGLAVRPRQPR